MGNEVLKGERKIIKYKVMKKILYCLLLLLSVFTINAKPRKIVIDKQVENARIIEAQGTSIGGFTATKILFIGLQTWVSPQDTSLVVVTNVNTSVPLGAFYNSIMLIKTKDGRVIELRSATSDNNTTDIKYGNPSVTTTIWKNRITSTYNSNQTTICRNINYWIITPEIINELSKGIEKIKIQYENGVYEKEFKKDEIGKVLYDSYITEQDYIQMHKEDDNFRQDF